MIFPVTVGFAFEKTGAVTSVNAVNRQINLFSIVLCDIKYIVRQDILFTQLDEWLFKKVAELMKYFKESYISLQEVKN